MSQVRIALTCSPFARILCKSVLIEALRGRHQHKIFRTWHAVTAAARENHRAAQSQIFHRQHVRLTIQNSRMAERIASRKVAVWLLQLILNWHRVATRANAVRQHSKQYYGGIATARCRLQHSIDIWRCRTVFIALRMNYIEIKCMRQVKRAENEKQLASQFKESLLENLQVRSNLADQRERVVQRTMLRWIRRQLANTFCVWCRHVISANICWVCQARGTTARR